MEQKIFIKNNKGLKLASVIHQPDDNAMHPAVILLHGFTGYKDEEHIAALARDLVNHGFVAIRFDASGFGKSEGTVAEDYRFSNHLQDIEIIYDYLCSQNFVDKNRVGVWGHSMGGMLSIVISSLQPGIKATVCVSVPILMGTSDLLRNAINDWKRTGWLERVSSKYGKIRIPYEFIIDAKVYNMLNFVKEVKQPLLVILGKVDKIVNPSDTKQIYERADQPKQLLEIDGMGHDYKLYNNYIKIVNDAVIKFFQANI